MPWNRGSCRELYTYTRRRHVYVLASVAASGAREVTALDDDLESLHICHSERDGQDVYMGPDLLSMTG